MAQNEHVLRQWMMEQEAQAQQQEYALNKSRQGLASNLNPGLLAGGGAPRHQQLQNRMQSLTGPMYPDGRQTQNEIRSGTGIRPNYPTPELKMHKGEVSPSRQPAQQIGLLDDARQYARGLVPEAVRDGLMNAQTWMRGGEARTPVSSEDVTNKSATELLINGYDRENMEGSGTDPLGIVTRNWGLVDDTGKKPAATARNNRIAMAMFKDASGNGRPLSNLSRDEQREVAASVMGETEKELRNYADPSGVKIYDYLPPQYQALVLDAKFHTGITFKNLMRASLNHMVNPTPENLRKVTEESKRGSASQRRTLAHGYDNRVAKLFNSVGLPFDASALPSESVSADFKGMNYPAQESVGNFIGNRWGGPQPYERPITAPPEMYNPPDATMTLTKPFPITSSTRQSPPNLGLGQRAGGTYGDADMQRMVALSQQLQNQSVA